MPTIPRKSTTRQEPWLAQPDGTVRWTPTMRAGLARFRNAPCPCCGRTLQAAHSLAQNSELLQQHPMPPGQHHGARLQLLQWHGGDAVTLFTAAQPRKQGLVELVQIQRPEVVDHLVARVSEVPCKLALARLAGRWPVFVLRRLLATAPARHHAAAVLVQELLAAEPAWEAPLRAQADDAESKVLDRLLAASPGAQAALADAPPERWPALLQSPPWRHRDSLPAWPTLDLPTAAPQPARFHWEALAPRADLHGGAPHDGAMQLERARKEWAEHQQRLMSECMEQATAAGVPAEGCQAWRPAERALWLLGADADRLAELLERGAVDAADFGAGRGLHWFGHASLGALPPALALQVLRLAPAALSSLREAGNWLGLLAHLGPEALPEFLRWHRQGSRAAFALAQGIDWAGLAPWVAHGLCFNRWVQAEAQAWLRSHPGTAAQALLPLAFGAAGDARDAARHALRWMHGNGLSEPLMQAAQAAGDGVAQALAQALAIDPAALLPDTLPALPPALPLATLPRLVLREGGQALPVSTLPDVLMALQLSRPEAPHAGLVAVQDAVTADSLARFGRALMAWWLGTGAPARERWAFALQGQLGDDETARVLLGVARQARVALNRVRAYDAMEMMGRIGSDAALMHLNELAVQTRHNDLQQRAQALLNAVAEQRGLTLEELADRTVPDLGLDAMGRCVLDFGARQFELRLDDNLQPLLRDATGRRLAALPKPSAHDDAGRAAEAHLQVKALKAQARALGAAQLRRLESAMCTQRRWPAADFVRAMVAHPVMRVFTRRLVWASFGTGGALQATFRIEDDRSLRDADDEPWRLDDDATVGLPHPLELARHDPGTCAAWSALLADYELLQPFEQLGRATYEFAAGQEAASELVHWRGRTVSTGALLGLEAKGWQRQVGDGGMVDHFRRALPDGATVTLWADPGWFVQGVPDPGTPQHIAAVRLGPGERPLSSLPAVWLSEVERDLHGMNWR